MKNTLLVFSVTFLTRNDTRSSIQFQIEVVFLRILMMYFIHYTERAGNNDMK